MKDAVLTIRLPLITRRRIEQLAREEGRSLSQQVERLIERGMGTERAAPARKLSGVLAGGPSLSLSDFREVRQVLSDSLESRVTRGRHRVRR